VCPKTTAKLPKIVAFSNWLLAEAADDARHLQELTSASQRGKRVPRRPALS
jgi:hypothetical protein